MAFQRFLCVADHSAITQCHSLQFQYNPTNIRSERRLISNFLPVFPDYFHKSASVTLAQKKGKVLRARAAYLWSIYEVLD